MKFVDQVRVLVRAGDGGNGAVAWRREAHVARGGPAGGDGGRGGNVVLVADEAMTTLLDLKFRQHLEAEDGTPGGTKDKNGRAGKDLVVRVPVGTMVFLEGVLGERGETPPWARSKAPRDGGMEVIHVGHEGPAPSGTADQPRKGEQVGDLTGDGDALVVVEGGRGGRGNIHFRSATNQTPDKAEPGEIGGGLYLRMELKLLADVGIVGFPNVGKSTLISKISRARPRVADYPFTTLVPNLGVVSLSDDRTMVVADVPGLIRGAADGRGLGHDFLRHLERTRVLLHFLALDFEPDREPIDDLDALEDELRGYGDMFDGRPRVVALNKADLLQDEAGLSLVAELRERLRERNIPLFVVSAATGEGLPQLLEAVWRRLGRTRDGAEE
jgi:GTP-binding protein